MTRNIIINTTANKILNSKDTNQELETKNFYLFLLICFTFSWFFWIPKALMAQGLIFPPVLSKFISGPFNPGAFGPLIAAFYLTYKNKGKLGIIALLKRGIDLKFNKKWLIPILLLMPVVTGGALLLSKITGDTLPAMPLLYNPFLIFYWFFYLLLRGGPLQEEFGWRGYALDRIQSRYTAFTSSVILGFIWAFWHLPLNFTSDVGPQYSLLLSMFIGSIVTMILLSILFTWIYNNTGKSILAAILFHTSINLSTYKLFPVFELQSAVPHYTILILIVVIIVLVFWGRKKLVRD